MMYACRWAYCISLAPRGALFKSFLTLILPMNTEFFFYLEHPFQELFLGRFLGFSDIASVIGLAAAPSLWFLSTLCPLWLWLVDVLRPVRQAGRLQQTPDTTAPAYCEIQKAFPGSYRLNQYCMNLSGKGLNLTGVHLYIKLPHSNFK